MFLYKSDEIHMSQNLHKELCNHYLVLTILNTSFMKRQASDTSSDNEWQRATSSTTSINKWHEWYNEW